MPYIIRNIRRNIMKLKRRVFENIANGQKLITIPRYCNIVAGDYVWVEEIKG